MKLADQVLRGNVQPPWWQDQEDDAERSTQYQLMLQRASIAAQVVTQSLPKCPVIVADDVARTFAENAEKSNRGAQFYDYTCLAPPWTEFWIEYDPNPLRTSVEAKRSLTRVGCFFTALDRKTTEADAWDEAVTLRRLASGMKANGDREWDEDEVFSMLACAMWIQAHDGVFGPVGIFDIVCDQDGRPLDIQYALPGATMLRSPEPENVYARCLVPALNTIELLHCRNVTTVEHRVPKKVAKKRESKGLPAGLRWRHVIVQPLNSRARYDAGAAGGRDVRGMHVVPGQMRHYGDCCPGRHEPHGLLFGRMEGRFWVPMHARGNPEHGIVVNDLEVRQ